MVGSAHPVIVVGAGPVGLTAAAVLASGGVSTVVVEAEGVPSLDWRASTFHPATLELLEQVDVAEQMRREGLAVGRFQFRDRVAGLVAEFDFGLLRAETRYPYRLQLNQQRLVQILHDRLQADGRIRLLFGAQVTDVATGPDRVGVRVQTADGARMLDGSYLVGADGASSTVRRALGVPFEGFTYPERFMIVSTSVDLRGVIPDLADVNYVADPHEWLFLLRTPESWRVVWAVPPGQSDEEATRPAVVQARLQGIAPLPDGYPVIDQQIYPVHQRVAATFRVGRAVLVGDAAHVNSPLGGVGLNSGIHDAVDVATRLVRLHATDPPADAAAADVEAELETFAAIRRRVAVEYVQADTERNTERLKERDEARRLANQAELRAIAADPDRARAWLRRVSLLESVRRFGIGRPPGATTRAETGEIEEASHVG
jgi:2-polyprenyl-6-methoxyphenol hydroxylase-like FAD-dependent oxidoreductase